MANVIDILIKAIWTGGPAVQQASGGLRTLGNAAAASSIEMAAAQASSQLLAQQMSRLGQEVALGNITVSEATRQYQAFAASLTPVEIQAGRASTSVGGLSANIGGLVTKIGLATAGFYALKRGADVAYGAIKAGADIELTTRRFDLLADSIGTTGDALRRDLSVAMQGLTSDLDAVRLGTNLMALGLVKGHDEAVRLAAASSQLNFDLNELVLTLTNQTVRRFDQLGVSTDGFKEKVNELKEAGLEADEAFRLAFIQQAEAQIELVGNVAETTAGQLLQIESAWQNIFNALKEGVAEGAAPVIEDVFGPILAEQESVAALQQFEKATGDIDKQREAVKKLKAAFDRLDLADVGRNLNFLFGEGTANFLDQSGEARKALIDLATEATIAGETLEEQQAIWESLGFVVDETGVSLGLFKVEYEELTQALIALEASDADKAMLQLALGANEAAEAVGLTAEEINEINEKLEEIELDKLTNDLGISEETWLRLVLTLGSVAAAQEYLTKVQQDAGQATDDLTISVEDQNEALAKQQKFAQTRAQAFLDFQETVTDITEREGERREEIEGNYEEQRSEIVRRYGIQRAQNEEDFQRNRQRAEKKYQDSINETREDSDERQQELRERANERLADLERDHLRRIEDIIEDADIRLTEAAGRLDAAAVVAIQRQREKALEDEKESYADSRSDIQRQLDRQLEAEREASAERLAKVEEFNDDRRRIEDEDRAIRLQREQDAHDERLRQLDDQQAERLDRLVEQTNDERIALAEQYADTWTQITDITGEALDTILDDADQLLRDLNAILSGEGGGPSSFPLVGPNVTNLPAEFFQSAGQTNISIGDIVVQAGAGASPEATGDAVADRLIALFETFNR